MRLPVALRGLRRLIAPPREEAFDLAVDRALVRVAVKRVSTSRRFTLRVRAASQDVVLTMPKRASAKEARAFVERHANWLAVRLARLPKLVPFTPGAIIPLRGVDHRLVHDSSARSMPHRVDVESEPILRAGGDAAFFSRRVTDYLKREARRELESAVAGYCRKLSLPPAPLTLRDTTSRWGSCTSKGRLNFSWRLILAPDFVLDYLAAHEVAHLRHMNHSPAYWRVLKDMCPATDHAEAWLKAQGSQLHRFGTG
jgi:predicted metal-dependent hydrolase